jgi:phage terminase large subunit-like protein
MTAFTLMFKKDGKDYYKHRFYIPEGTLKDRYRKENINMPAWVEKGIITAIPGETIDYDYIIRDILEDAQKYKIIAIGYDKWQSRDVIDGIEEERPDLLLVEIEQSLKKLSPITKSYEKSIKDGLLVDNNPVMLWMINNVEIKPDVNGNYKPMKKNKSSTQRIDGVIASLMAHSLSINDEINNQGLVSMSFDTLKALL